MRRPIMILVIAVAAVGLASCGKKGSPQPPGESDFPRGYPNPAMYPHPGVPSGTATRNAPPEQGSVSTTTDDNEDDLGFNPGRMSR